MKEKPHPHPLQETGVGGDTMFSHCEDRSFGRESLRFLPFSLSCRSDTPRTIVVRIAEFVVICIEIGEAPIGSIIPIGAQPTANYDFSSVPHSLDVLEPDSQIPAETVHQLGQMLP